MSEISANNRQQARKLLAWKRVFTDKMERTDAHRGRTISHAGVLGCSQCVREREREMFYLTTHSTHFIYGYMASDIWLRTILIVRKETRCRHIGYSYRLTARVLLYAPSHRQDNTYHGLCYTSRGALAGTPVCACSHLPCPRPSCPPVRPSVCT